MCLWNTCIFSSVGTRIAYLQIINKIYLSLMEPYLDAIGNLC